MGPVLAALAVVALLGGVWFVLKGRGDAPSAADSAGGAGPATRAGGRARVDWLIGVAGDVAGKEFHVGERVVTIGRAPANLVQTTDPEASRKHCQLRMVGDTLELTDMSSRNGTEVNGQFVKAARLSYGDRIRIGDAELVFMRHPAAGTDSGLDRKVAGRVAVKSTKFGQGLEYKGVIAQTIAQCDGDLRRAADVLGCDLETLERLIEKEKRSSGQG